MKLNEMIEALQGVQEADPDNEGFQFHIQAALESLAACGEDMHFAEGDEYTWSGPIAFEDVETGDHRKFNSGAIKWDPATLPWAFRWQRTSGQGHGGAIPIGRVDGIERGEDGKIYGRGVVIPSLNDEAAEYVRLLKAGVAGGVSVDGDSAEFEVMETAEGQNLVNFSSMRLRSLTAVDVPAFNNARIKLEHRPEDDEEREKAEVAVSEGTMRDHWTYSENLVAAAIPVKPSTAAFLDPKFDGPQAISIGENGEVYGHLALWDTCHLGIQNGCTKPPRNGTYRFFHTGEIETEEGELVQTGRLTFNTGHASMSANPKVAAAHYDNTGVVAADVRAGEDEYGIWVVGALRPHLSDADIRTFRAAPLSGDWRRIAGRLELVGALAVNTPGFPVPRARVLVASGETQTLFTYTETEAADKKAELAARFAVLAGEPNMDSAEVQVESVQIDINEDEFAGLPPALAKKVVENLKKKLDAESDPDKKAEIQVKIDKFTKKAELQSRMIELADGDEHFPEIPTLDEVKERAKNITKEDLVAGVKAIRELLDDTDQNFDSEMRAQMQEVLEAAMAKLPEMGVDAEEFHVSHNQKSHGGGGGGEQTKSSKAKTAAKMAAVAVVAAAVGAMALATAFVGYAYSMESGLKRDIERSKQRKRMAGGGD